MANLTKARRGSSGTWATVPIDLGPDTSAVMLQFAVTGVRAEADPTAYGGTIGDRLAPVIMIDVSAATPGVDLVTLTRFRAVSPGLANWTSR